MAMSVCLALFLHQQIGIAVAFKSIVGKTLNQMRCLSNFTCINTMMSTIHCNFVFDLDHQHFLFKGQKQIPWYALRLRSILGELLRISTNVFHTSHVCMPWWALSIVNLVLDLECFPFQGQMQIFIYVHYGRTINDKSFILYKYVCNDEHFPLWPLTLNITSSRSNANWCFDLLWENC